MPKNNIRPMVEGGVLSAVAVLFAIFGLYFPFLGQFVHLLLPVPMVLLGIRHGYRWSLMAVAVTGILVALLTSPLQAVSIVVGICFTGVALGHGMRKGFSAAGIMMIGTVVSFLSKIALLLLTGWVMGVNALEMQFELFDQTMGPAIDIYRTMGVSDETIAQMQEILPRMLALLKAGFWALLAMSSLLETFLNVTAAHLVLRRLGSPHTAFPPFRRWGFPKYLLYLFLISLGMMYLGDYKDIIVIKNIGINIAIGTGFFLGIQGAAVVTFLTDKYRVSKLMRNLIYLVIFLYGLHFFVFIGAFDMVVDYRRLKEGSA